MALFMPAPADSAYVGIGIFIPRKYMTLVLLIGVSTLIRLKLATIRFVFSGDIDDDGVVDESNFMKACVILAGNTEFENPAQFVAADLNGDGYYTQCDYTLLKSVLTGANILYSATGELTHAV